MDTHQRLNKNKGKDIVFTINGIHSPFNRFIRLKTDCRSLSFPEKRSQKVLCHSERFH